MMLIKRLLNHKTAVSTLSRVGTAAFLSCYLPQKPIYINVLEEFFVVVVGVGRHQFHTMEVFAS